MNDLNSIYDYCEYDDYGQPLILPENMETIRIRELDVETKSISLIHKGVGDFHLTVNGKDIPNVCSYKIVCDGPCQPPTLTIKIIDKEEHGDIRRVR